MLARLGRVFLVVAVLLAQQAAIGHQVWHLSSSNSVAGDATKAPKGDRLCSLHDLLGTVLGVASGPAPQHALLALEEVACEQPACLSAESRWLPPQSRGPPSIS